MHGFIITIGGCQCPVDYGSQMNARTLEVGDGHVIWATNHKFPKDEVLIDDDTVAMGLSGVIVNNNALVEKYGAKNWVGCVEQLFHSKGDTFYNEFRGTFCGFVYNKTDKTWTFFTDHIGDKQILYSHSEKGLAVATEVDYMAHVLKQNGVSLTLDKEAAYMALTLGYCDRG